LLGARLRSLNYNTRDRGSQHFHVVPIGAIHGYSYRYAVSLS
jgi:hypothetical protein